MPKKGIGSQMVQAWGEGTNDPFSPEMVRAEFAKLADFFISGGPVGAAGPITEVKGLRLILSYAMTVDAPEITWAELHSKTVPDTAEVEAPKDPARLGLAVVKKAVDKNLQAHGKTAQQVYGCDKVELIRRVMNEGFVLR